MGKTVRSYRDKHLAYREGATVAESRQQPLWLKAVLTLCGPLGVGLALFGVVNPLLGTLFVAVTVIYLGWEFHPQAHLWTKEKPRMSLAAFLLAGAALGFVFWVAMRRPVVSTQALRSPSVAKSAPENELQTQQHLLKELRNEYIEQHPEKVTPGLLAGREDPPTDWLNQQLEHMGESLRFKASRTRPESALEDPLVESAGFHEAADTLTFSMGAGGMTASQTLERLASGKSRLFVFGNFEPVKVTKRGNKLLVNFKLWGGNGKPPVEVEGNVFKANTPMGWDRNSCDNAIEVINPHGTVMFQMIRRTATDIVFNGVFPLPDGNLLLAGPSGVTSSRTVPASFTLEPIFKYPSWKYPGKFADGTE